MAAEVNARHNRQQTIAFTLPISCQICLGKVKNPVLCPNQHVFCGPCMEVWLQKNKQCPACRVAMTSTKKIIGGLSEQDEDPDKLTNPELRKARFDILYKEYENEFERMSSEILLLKTENQILKQQTRKDGLTPSRPGDSDGGKNKDTSHLLALTKKLQDATKLYEKVKTDLTRLKQENTNLKDENLSLNRENQHVRQELAGRSPHRYGRITVSTLESKLASAEKDVTRLTKALERSDKYIEELEAELEGYRGGKPGASKRHNSATDRDDKDKYLTNGDVLSRKYSSDSKVPQARDYGVREDNPSRRQLFSGDKGDKPASGERSKYSYERNGDFNDDMHAGKSQTSKSNGANGGKKRVTFDLDKNTNSAISFDLELPSPLKNSANASSLANGRASPVKGVLKKSGNGKSGSGDQSSDGYSTDMSKTLEDSLSDSYKYSADKYSGSKDDDLLYLRKRTKEKDYSSDVYSKPRRKYSVDDSVLSEPSDLEIRNARDKNYSSKRSEDYDRDRLTGKKSDTDYRSHNRQTDKLDELDRHDLDDTQYIESELDELNISLTPEFTDCMKILNRAEKNVNTRDSDTEDYTSRYRSTVDTDMDAALRASTGSIGYRSGARATADDGLYKPDTNTDRFASSLDSYSRGRHVRSGSLDNLLMDQNTDNDSYRPGSALGTTTSLYPPTSQSKYSSGLTTGRTTLTRTPSLDNLLLARQSTGHMNKYSAVEDSLGLGGRPGYLGQRLFRGEKDTAGDGHLSTGMSSTTVQQPLTAKHDILATQVTGTGDRLSSAGDKISSYDPVLDARSRVYSTGDAGSTIGAGSSSISDVSRKLPPSGRQTPTLASSSSGLDFDKLTSTGRIAPTIPTHSEYMGYTKPSTEKYSMSGSGRSTPTLTSQSDYTGQSNTGMSQYTDYRASGPSSLPADLTQKPPISGRSYATSYSNQAPPYQSTSLASTNPGGGYSSLPSYSGSGLDSAPYSTNLDTNKYTSSTTLSGRTTDTVGDKNDFVPSSNYRSDSNYSASGNHAYNDLNYKDGTDFSKFSTKVGASSSSSSYAIQPPPSSNPLSASSAGLSSYSSSYLPTSSLASSTSYATSHSVPITHSSSSYTASNPASNAYMSKPLDPITETGHYSYVSNMSADFSSKNDTLALPEPKRKLFETTDDLEMSMSPIKSNRRY
ncbi:OBI1-like protein [Mya arenaria]|uniref:OBI1-like protein n=1 Tax=Mya arenaria TaxID=6604 RepID=A0ABY7DST8_MYAAR|nr:uncharacterized protein LOC128227055 isoform X2 [Mya arenaria]WAQ99681.1 OBI1-like protein [Mya arenaria]